MSESVIIKSDPNKSIEQMRAEVAAFEANPIAPNAPDTPTVPTVVPVAPVVPTEKPVTPAPITPPAEEKTKVAQQPKETDGKAVQTAEPVKETNWKEAYEGLQRKYNKTFLEKKEQGTETQPPAPQKVQGPPDVLSAEFRQQFAADLEKDPVEALVRLNRLVTQAEVSPIKSKFEQAEEHQLHIQRLSGLERLANDGNEWLKTPDGLRKMEAVLTENPELWQTKDPYRAALGFISDIPSKTENRGSAQSTGLTPILGASGALPPSVSAPVVSKQDTLIAMQAQVTTFISRGQMAQAQETLKKMEELERGY